MLAQQSISDARNILFEQGQLFKTPYESLFYHVILGTILSITQLIVIVRWVSLKIFDRLTILALINTYLVSTIGLGRFILFYFILFYAMTSIFHRFLGLTTNKQSSKFFFMNIKRLILSASLLIIGTLAIVWTTLQRFGLNKIDLSIIPLAFELIVEQLVIYFTGCFRAFDQYLNSEYFKYIYGMGRATFGGIGEGINYFILISVDHGSRSMTNQLESYAFNQINIGNGHLYNAFYTCLMPYHVDGGVVGIMLFSGIFGWVFGKLYRNYRKNSSSWDLLILVYFSVTMILGLLRYQFLGLVPWLVLVGLYLMRYYSNRFNRCNIV
jgi:oligosaccharide repeat unit polymerase